MNPKKCSCVLFDYCFGAVDLDSPLLSGVSKLNRRQRWVQAFWRKVGRRDDGGVAHYHLSHGAVVDSMWGILDDWKVRGLKEKDRQFCCYRHTPRFDDLVLMGQRGDDAAPSDFLLESIVVCVCEVTCADRPCGCRDRQRDLCQQVEQAGVCQEVC